MSGTPRRRGRHIVRGDIFVVLRKHPVSKKCHRFIVLQIGQRRRGTSVDNGLNKKRVLITSVMNTRGGAGGGTRTHTMSPSTDFE